MKKGYFKTYIKTLFFIVVIIAVIVTAIYFLKDEYDDEHFETIKTDMLLLEGKTKVMSETVKMKQKGASYMGRKLKDALSEEQIKTLQDNKLIDTSKKEHNYYVLEKADLETLGLEVIDIKGYYIVEYTNNEIIYSEGIENKTGDRLYQLSEIKKAE